MTTINWINPSCGRGRAAQNGPQTPALRLAVSMPKDGRAQSTLTITKPMMKRLGILIGDRIAVGDAGDRIAFKRVPSGGYAVSASGAKKAAGSTEKYMGTSEVAGIVKWTKRFDHGSAHVEGDPMIVDGVFFVPKSSD